MPDKARILVVDDSLVNLAVINEILEQQGFDVLLANTGERALKSAQEMPPDLILLDVMMPGWDGYETCRRIKSDPIIGHIPILFISGLGDTKNKVEAFQVGAVDYVSKPFQEKELLARVHTHVELARLRQNLEKEVESKTAKIRSLMEALQISYQKAQEASVLKTQFLRNISHEFRTPMNIILGVTEELKEETPLNEEQKEMTDEVIRSGKLLLEVLDNMLNFADQFAGELRQEVLSFNLRKMVNELIESYVKNLPKELTLMTTFAEDLPETLRGNRNYIQEVLHKFLDNAVKFTHRGEIKVSVDLLYKKDRGIGVRLNVSDTGIGISEQQQEHLFEAFSQVDSSSTRRYGGLGMGLALAKLYCDSMNAEIGVNSQEGKGSTFYFTVYLEKA